MYDISRLGVRPGAYYGIETGFCRSVQGIMISSTGTVDIHDIVYRLQRAERRSRTERRKCAGKVHEKNDDKDSKSDDVADLNIEEI